MLSEIYRVFFSKRFFSANVAGPVQRAITEKLTKNFLPTHLRVLCESRLHHEEKGVEKHFRVQIVSEKFEGLSLLQMHKLVNNCLADEIGGVVHALRLETYPPSKYRNNNFLSTANCGCKKSKKHDLNKQRI
uniref:BolA-like protein 1 n=1 Tax=Syphacia muris TaxID=451379 RepID=A0A0N5AF68_9BILA